MNANHQLRLLAVASFLALPSVATAAWNFPNGNLLLGVQATGGSGATKNVFFNIGSGTAFRDGQITGVVGNINADLSAAFGSNWYTRSDVHFGVIGNLNSGPNPPTFGGLAAVNGDPSRTFYVSIAASTPGSGSLFTGVTSNALGAAGNNFAGQETMVLSLSPTASGAAVLDSSDSVGWANGWTTWNPPSGAAYGTFSGSIQNSFGQAGTTTYVDVQRILSTNTGASPAGTVASGTYEGSVGITSTGDIVVTVGGTATPFETWALTFPALDTPAKRLPSADPDNDGSTNLMEFLLNGDPSVSDPSILPHLNLNGSNFVFSFNRRDDAETGSTLIFQYGSNLSGWTDVVIDNDGGVVGSANVGVAENSTNPDAITVTLPTSVAVGGRLFGRILYTQP